MMQKTELNRIFKEYSGLDRTLALSKLTGVKYEI